MILISSFRKFLFVFLLFSLDSALADNANVQEYHLKNGLTLLVKEDHRSPVVFSSVWYKVGGSYESDGATGVSHALEHMMFRGSKNYPAGAVEKLINENGGDQNAMTTNDQTIYYQRLSADKLPLSFQIESDRMQNLLLKKSDFEKEIQVVMEERRMRFDDNPMALTYERFMAAALVNNPYHHQTIGWMTDLENMTVDNVRQWYHAWYTPNNAIIVVVGDVNPAQVHALANQYFGNIPSSPVPSTKPRTEIPALGTKRVDVNVPAKVPVIFMGYQVPSMVTTRESELCYALDVLTALLGGSASSRFSEDLVRGKQIASYAQASYDPLQLYSSLLTLVGVPAQGHNVQELEQAFREEITALQTKPITQTVLARIKAQVVAAEVYQRDSLANQAMELGGLVSIHLPWQLSKTYVTQIDAVTPEQVQTVAKKFLTDDRLTVAVLHPQGEPKQSDNAMPMTTGGGLH